jgi:hypothetical protein
MTPSGRQKLSEIGHLCVTGRLHECAVVRERPVVRLSSDCVSGLRVDDALCLFLLVRGDIDQHRAGGPAAKLPAADKPGEVGSSG